MRRGNEYRKIIFVIVLVTIAMVLSGCASQSNSPEYQTPGFLMGIVHGFIMLFSLIGSIFMDIRIYSVPNSGILYDFGYLIGASLFLGGSGASTR